jgi:hypothetical protein
VLLRRCQDHIQKHYNNEPPSKGEYRKDEPDGWRCDSWEEVRRRCGSLDVFGGHETQTGASSALVVSNDGGARMLDGDATTPNSRPRTLELYAGRGGWSANHVRQGCDSWYLEWDRKAIEPSFSEKPEYHEHSGMVLCKNGLDPSKLIQLDFLDLAMAVLKQEVNVGDLHAIHGERYGQPLPLVPISPLLCPSLCCWSHISMCTWVCATFTDGLDCATFTDLAKSTSQRLPSNAFAGMSAKAYRTNIRYHYLCALYVFLDKRLGSMDNCVLSGENPKAARRFHPLTRNVLELKKADGGLGMTPVEFSMCHVGDPEHTFQKHTSLWLTHKPTLQYFVTDDGSPRKLCCEERPCAHFGECYK